MKNMASLTDVTRRELLLGSLSVTAASTLIASAAAEASYPVRPVRVVVPIRQRAGPTL